MRPQGNYEVDLVDGVVPLTKAATELPKLAQQSLKSGPIVITQNGVPIAAYLHIRKFQELIKELRENQAQVDAYETRYGPLDKNH